MGRIWPAVASGIALVLALSACGDPSGAGAGGTGGDGWPGERTFLSTSVTEAGRDRPLVPGSRIMLSFGDDGTIDAQADCNHLASSAKIEHSRLVVVGGLAGTEMGCDPALMDQDSWLAAFLMAQPTFRLSGDELVLGSDDTQIKLLDRRVADPDRPLAGTRWVVDTIIQGESASSIPGDREAVLRFDGSGRFTGSTGCVEVTGTARVLSDTIRIAVDGEPVCEPADAQPLHDAVLRTLRGDVGYRIEARRLTLTGPGGWGLGLAAA
jgi:heat shock protein HslJ